MELFYINLEDKKNLFKKEIIVFGVKIVRMAHYLPHCIVDNEEILKRYPEAGAQEKIFKKTGIKERRYSEFLTTADMATKSAIALLEKTEISASEIDCVIVGTSTPDYFFPPTAPVVIGRIKAVNASGFDINAACPSFLVAVEQAVMKIALGNSKNIIVCGVDRMSKALNLSDYKTGLLFGDASCSALLSARSDHENGINHCYSKVVADNLEDIYFKTPFFSNDWPNEKFKMDGKKVYQRGIELTVKAVREFLNKYSLSLDGYKFIIPHQSNVRIIEKIAKQLKCSMDKFLTNIETVGNTASASVPLCLSQKIDEGIVKKGDRLLLVSYGAGYTISIVDLFF